MDLEQYIFNTPKPLYPAKPLLKGKTAKDHREYADKLEAWESEMIKYKENLRQWYEAKDEMRNKFKQDLFRELNILNHPRANDIFQIAWDERYDDQGLEGVFSFTEKLASLLS